MPIAAVALSKVTRSPSLLSEQSSSLSESPRHVSFNQDVSIKRIPKKAVRNTRSNPISIASTTSSSSAANSSSNDDDFSGKCQDFVNLPPPSDATEVAAEAEGILKQLEDIECSVSDNPHQNSITRNSRKRVKSPTPATGGGTTATSNFTKTSRLFASNPNLNRVKSPTLFGGSNNNGSGSKYSTLERIPFLGGRLSKSSSDLLAGLGKKKADRLIPGEQGVSLAPAGDNNLSASTGILSAAVAGGMRVEGSSEQEDGQVDNRLYGLQALNKLDNAVNGKVSNLYKDSSGSTDYSPPPKKNNYTPPKPPRKATSTSPPPSYNRKGYSSLDELEIGSKPIPEKMEYSPPYPGSYTSANPNLQHLRSSPSRFSPARQSPSRGNHTDSELLSSPSQTRNRSGSKENILDEPAPYRYNNMSPAQHSSRSLERGLDSDKENRRQELKARIHVTSPHRFTPERQVARKPYKTTINTANDTIQYKGFSQENLQAGNRQQYDRPVFGGGRKFESEHYKVPKNKVPVPAEFATAPTRSSRRHESDTTSSSQNNYVADMNRQHFQSATLVRNAHSETRQKVSGEYDREGRRIRSERRAAGGERNRAYSGYSTSPDREMSPDRYARPRGSSAKVYPSFARSPSTSPTRPPRTRAASSGEIIVPVRREHSARRVERTPSTRAAATSRSPIKKIQRVHNEIQADNNPKQVRSRDPRDPQSYRSGRDGRDSSASGQRPVYRDVNGVGSRTLTLNRDKTGARGTKSVLMKKSAAAEDRLAKYTMYRGDNEVEAEKEVDERRMAGVSRRSSHSVGDRLLLDSVANNKNYRSGESDYERERGHSVPPGANIGSMKDFYNSPQYRSMYHLPPSPTRAAPSVPSVSPTRQMTLERPHRTTTLERSGALLRRERSGGEIVNPAPPRRISKASISEGELTDDLSGRQERVQRHRAQFINNLNTKTAGGDLSRQSSRAADIDPRRMARGGEGRRQGGVSGGSREREKRPAPQPPTQRIRRSSVDVLETSVSESDSPRQGKHTVEYIEYISSPSGLLDYTASPSGLLDYTTTTTQEEDSDRGGGGGSAGLGPGPQAVRVYTSQRAQLYAKQHQQRPSSVVYLRNRLAGYSSNKAKSDAGNGWIQGGGGGQSDIDGDLSRRSEPEMEYHNRRASDVDTDYRREMLNSVHSEARGRDGGRRDVVAPPSIYQQAATLNTREIEISQDDEEEEVVRSPTSLAREEERRKILELERKGVSLSRSSSRVTSKIMGLKGKKPDAAEVDSQYSGHSSSSLRKDGGVAGPPRTRLNNGAPRSAIKRNGSTATTASSSRVAGRRKMPSSVTSSLNSSESEHGSVPHSHAGSRATNASNKSVYLHATAVADIPSMGPNKGAAAGEQQQSNLKNSKKISRSISLLTPFKSKKANAPANIEVNYDNTGNQIGNQAGKPPRPPPQASAGRRIQPTMTKEKKFASSSDLLRDESSSGPETGGGRIGGLGSALNGKSDEGKSSKVSRSVSMPKDTRLAGWFKKRKK